MVDMCCAIFRIFDFGGTTTGGSLLRRFVSIPVRKFATLNRCPCPVGMGTIRAYSGFDAAGVRSRGGQRLAKLQFFACFQGPM